MIDVSNEELEKSKFEVPRGMGAIVANYLRQVAIRGDEQWQIAACCLGAKADGFGLAYQPFSAIEVLNFKLNAGNFEHDGPLVAAFLSDSKGFRYEDMYVETPLPIAQEIKAMDVVLVKDTQGRTAEDNYKLTKRLVGSKLDDYIVVPSLHLSTEEFMYEVEEGDNKDIVTVEATQGSYRRAVKSAYSALQGLL